MPIDEDPDEPGEGEDDEEGPDAGLPVTLHIRPTRLVSAELDALIKAQVDRLPEDADWHVAYVAYAEGQGNDARIGVAVVTRKDGIFTDDDTLTFSFKGEVAKGGKPGWRAELAYAK